MTLDAQTRILLVNHWHDDNRGDGAITQGLLTLLEEVLPQHRLTVTTLTEEGPLWRGSARHLTSAFPDVQVLPSPAPTELRGRSGHRRLVRRAADTAILLLRSSRSFLEVITGRPIKHWRDLVAQQDVVVLGGGSNIFDDAGVPAVLSLPRLLAVLGPAHTAIRLGVPVLLLGHTIGPFARPSGRKLARRMLAGADLAVIRESQSEDVAWDLGIESVREHPDLAFALRPTMSERVRRTLSLLPADARRTLVMSVRSHPTLAATANDRLLTAFAGAAGQLHETGVIDAVAVVAHTRGPTPIEDDRQMSRALHELLQHTDVPVTAIDEDFTPGELAALYGEVAAVATVRLHAAILALSTGTPAFAVSYLTHKTSGVMAQAGLPDAVAEFRTVTAAELADGVQQVLADPSLREQLKSNAIVRRRAISAAAESWFAPYRTQGRLPRTDSPVISPGATLAPNRRPSRQA